MQAARNPVYCEWCRLLGMKTEEVDSIEKIPFLPVRFFKSHSITCYPDREPERWFESSRTTGQTPSRHALYRPEWYSRVSCKIFQDNFGPLAGFGFVSLLPSYRQNPASSLITMVEDFARASGVPLVQDEAAMADLPDQLNTIREAGRKPVLFGVTFALLQATEQFSGYDEPFTLIETGGMKGHGKEITRQELHKILADAFPKADIRSEYGMTEMLSQGYTGQSRSERFTLPAWCRVLVREPRDPLSALDGAGKGVINMIDLANLDTCCFLALDDLCERFADQSFTVLGRMDQAEIRGCNLLVE